MRVLVTGATGLIGHAICQKLAQRKDQIYVVSRDKEKAKQSLGIQCEVIEGDLTKGPLSVPDLDVVIHLLGEPVIGRWTEEKKKKIYSSRIESTQNLGLSLRSQHIHLLAASAIGYYPSGDAEATEFSRPGKDFLSQVCIDWERESKKVGGDVTIFRISPVLAKSGGALAKMLPPFKMGVGGPLGSGKQWMSWIHIEDIASAFIWSLENKKFGVFNAAAPETLTNRDFSKILAEVLHRPLGPKVPKFALKLMFGEAAEVLLSSQRVTPAALLRDGFKFKFPTAKEALENLLK
jgi:uncharacterized protein